MLYDAADVTAVTPAFNVGRRRAISDRAGCPWPRIMSAPSLPPGTPKLDAVALLLQGITSPLAAIVDVDTLLGALDAERLLNIANDGCVALLSGHPDLTGFVLTRTDLLQAAVRDVAAHFPNPHWGGEDLLVRAALYHAGASFRATFWTDTLVMSHSIEQRRRPSGVHFAAHAHTVNQRAYLLADRRYGLALDSVAGLALLHPSSSSFYVERKDSNATTIR